MREWHIPGYEILEAVGEGGMAAVWKARQLSLDRIVALKVLDPGLIRDAEEIERFREEARAAARFHHPGLVQIYDAGESGGHVYYVMEYIEGRSIGQHLMQEGPLSEDEALKVVDEAADILGTLWERDRVVHCDIKPDNLLIDEEDHVRIADLGLARAIEQASKYSDRGLIVGTPNYASPEQAQGLDDLDCRTDIYGMGASLYHMLTGQLPFADKHGLDAMDEQITGYVPDPQEYRPDISNGAAWLMEKMLIKDREYRYRNWAEVRRDLAEVRRGLLPLGQLPPAGLSTVSRSANREAASLAQFNAMRPARSHRLERPTPREPSAKAQADIPRRKRPVVVHQPLQRASHPEKSRRPENTQQAISTMLFLFILVAGLYGGVFYSLSRLAVVGPEREADRVSEPYDDLVRPIPPAEPVQPAPRPREPLPPVQPEPAPEKEEWLDWDHPTYVEAMTLLREADKRHQQFLDVRDQSLLDDIEPKCRRAIQLFEAVRDEAPAEAQINERIRQSFQLISHSRQMRLLERRNGAPPGPDAFRTRIPRDIGLARNLNAPVPERMVMTRELDYLLSQHGTPEINLEPQPEILVFDAIFFLMHIDDALQWLEIARPVRRPVVCPGFPEDSMFYYKVSGEYRSGFDRLLLVTDARDQVVAAQLMSEVPREHPWLDAGCFEGPWRTYNFIQTRTKPNAAWKVGYKVEAERDMVRLDSELIDPDGAPALSLARVSLYMPKPLVNLILYRLNS